MEPESLVKLAFGIIGDLGIFLLGIKNMSEGMQAIAGSHLRRMISAVSNHRLMANGVGTSLVVAPTLITAVDFRSV